MKKYFSIFALLLIVQHSFSQSCVPTYSTVNVPLTCHQYPYVYHNDYYNYPGTYTVNLVNSQGCDSVVTLNLITRVPGTSTTYQTACESELPFFWGNQDITGAGTYSNYINVDGCSPEFPDSVVYLVVTVTPLSPTITNKTICTSQLPYSWNGQLYYEGGTYTVTLPNPNPDPAICGSIQTLNLSVIDPPVSNNNLTICSVQLPYAWNGQSLTAAGSYTAIIVTPNPNDCDSTAHLNLFVIQNKTSQTNRTVCANQLPFLWNGANYTATGTYTHNFPNGACDSIATLNLTVKPLSTISSFAPATATRNQAVVITGTNFSDATSIGFGGSPAASFTIISPTYIIATVGTAAAGSVTVTTGCNTASLAGFSYNASPGNMGIGTNNPTSKFTVGGGDLQIADIGSGIILKSPDGNCWRITIDNAGNLVRTAITCPQ